MSQVWLVGCRVGLGGPGSAGWARKKGGTGPEGGQCWAGARQKGIGLREVKGKKRKRDSGPGGENWPMADIGNSKPI
jgi:hypothetical protein